jgi:hypothetical protein
LAVVALDYLKQKQEIELASQRSVAGWEAQYMLCKLLQDKEFEIHCAIAKAVRDAALKELAGEPLNLIGLS